MIPIHESIISFLEAGDAHRAADTLIRALDARPTALAEIADALAAPLAALYHDFTLEPVEQFAAQLDENIARDMAAALLAPIRPDIEAAREWPARLEAVYAERLTRELRDAVQAGDLKTAAIRLTFVMHPRLPYEQRLHKARYIGGILGSLSGQQDNAKKLIGVLAANAAKLQLTGDMIEALQSECAKVYAQAGRLGVAAQLGLRDEFTNLVVAIQRQIPGRMDMREPAAGEIETFLRIARALLSAAFRPGMSDRLVDAAQVLLDFYPRELSGVGARAGVQARAYQSLGFTAKKLCLLAFGHLGESPCLCQTVLDFYKSAAGAPYVRQGIELMGAMRARHFQSFLQAALKDGALKAERFEIIKALGMIGEPESREALLDALREAVRAKVIDPPRVKQALSIIESLGRLSRSPRLGERDRVALTEQTIKALPPDQRRLTSTCAVEFFRQKPDVLPRHMRDWAAGQLIHGLWAGDETPAFAEGGEQESDFLGARRDLVATLRALGPESLPAIIEAAQQHILTYSGAFLALGEALTTFADPRAVPLLEKMFMLVINMDESAVGKYQQETYWDATTRERKPLGKNYIIDTLVFALSKTPGREAANVLREAAMLFRRGRIGAPSETTAQILMNIEKGIIDPQTGGAADDATSAGAPQYNDSDIRQAIKTLGSRGFLTSADSLRRKKISAMQIIAEAGAIEGLGVLARHLDDKDRMTREAAAAALQNFARHLTRPNFSKAYLVELVECVGDLSEEAQTRLGGLIQEFVLGDPMLTKQFTAYLETVEHPAARRVLSRALLTADLEKERQLAQLSGRLDENGEGEGGPGAGEAGNTTSRGTKNYASALEAKRQYMLARKAWVASGKKGPEPEKPAGVD